MAKRSQSKLAEMRAQRRETDAAQRRRYLRVKFPDVPTQVWAHIGTGLLQGAGAQALRAWLRSLEHVCAEELLPLDVLPGPSPCQRSLGTEFFQCHL